MTILVTALVVAVALLAVLVVGLLRSHAEILRALQELGVDFEADRDHNGVVSQSMRSGATSQISAGSAAARDLIGVAPEGDAMAVAVVDVQRFTLLAFLSSGCLTCHEFWSGFADPVRRAEVAGGANVVAVTKGAEAESPSLVSKLARGEILTILSSEAWDDYSVPVAPYFILVDGPSGTVCGEGSASTFDQLKGLLVRARADAAVAASASAGNGGPSIEGVSRRDMLDAVRRSARVDAELKAAGIEPGDPSLYHERSE